MFPMHLPSAAGSCTSVHDPSCEASPVSSCPSCPVAQYRRVPGTNSWATKAKQDHRVRSTETTVPPWMMSLCSRLSASGSARNGRETSGGHRCRRLRRSWCDVALARAHHRAHPRPPTTTAGYKMYPSRHAWATATPNCQRKQRGVP